MRLIFFGTSEFAVPALKKLVEVKYDIAAVITAPDALVGRKQVSTSSPVKKAAEALGLPILTPHTLKDDAFFEQFKNLSPDICIIAAYGKIIPQKYLDVPKHGFVNIHPSLLPRYRGPSPIQSAIIAGESETGVSIMLVDAQVDHGPLLQVTSDKVSSEKYYPEISQQLADIGAHLLIEVLPDYLTGKITPQEQDHSRATFTKKITSEDGQIDWNQSAETIYNKIRAYNPEPGTWTMWDGNILKILKAHPAPNPENVSTPGTVVKTNGDVAVQTGNGLLVLEQLQLTGKKPVEATAFLHGHPRFLAGRLS